MKSIFATIICAPSLSSCPVTSFTTRIDGVTGPITSSVYTDLGGGGGAITASLILFSFQILVEILMVIICHLRGFVVHFEPLAVENESLNL